MKVVKNTMGENLFSLSSVETASTESEIIQVTQVDKNKMCVNTSYQRPIDMARAKKIALNWDWRLCLPLLVCKNGGKYSIIDGDHRYAAAMMLDNVTFLPCIQFNKMAENTQAKLFIQCNSQSKPIKKLDFYRAGIIAKDEYCLQLQKIADKHGVKIGRGGKCDFVELSCVGTLILGLKHYNYDVMDKTIEVASKIGKSGVFDVVTFSIMFHGFAYYSKDRWKKLEADIARVGYDHIKDTIDNTLKSSRAQVRLDGQVRLVLVDLLLSAINYRKRENDRWTI